MARHSSTTARPARSAARRLALGWGSTTASPSGEFPDALRQTVIDVEPDSACAAVYGEGFNAATMLCAGVPQGGRDTCQGDSGGPLVAGAPDSTVVIGFTSFGGACGQAGAPGAYVRASVAAGWLATGGDTTAERTAALAAAQGRGGRRPPDREAEAALPHPAVIRRSRNRGPVGWPVSLQVSNLRDGRLGLAAVALQVALGADLGGRLERHSPAGGLTPASSREALAHERATRRRSWLPSVLILAPPGCSQHCAVGPQRAVLTALAAHLVGTLLPDAALALVRTTRAAWDAAWQPSTTASPWSSAPGWPSRPSGPLTAWQRGHGRRSPRPGAPRRDAHGPHRPAPSPSVMRPSASACLHSRFQRPRRPGLHTGA